MAGKNADDHGMSPTFCQSKMKKLISVVILSLVGLGIAGWFFYSQDRTVVRIGFVGGLSGRTADLGISGRNGAKLAVDIRNKSGGINGRQIELVIGDDKQDVETARKVVSGMIDMKVEAIIGPMTSEMAIEIVPIVNAAKMLTIGPTVTTNLLTGIDDQFFRVVGTTRDYAAICAQYHAQKLGLRRVAIFYDLSNRSYSESWSNDYISAFENVGGKVVKRIGYVSSKDLYFTGLVQSLANLQFDGVLIVGNSVDAAMLIKGIRRINQKVQIMASEWAATERLIEMGGRTVEGVAVAQFLDREDTHPSYISFREAYMEHHSGAEPGFAGLTAFEATNIVLDAIGKKAEGQSLKQAILSQEKFTGLQGTIRFDAYGDSYRDTYITTIRNAKFTKVR